MEQEYQTEEIAVHPAFIKWMTSDTDIGSYWQNYATQSPAHFKKVQQAIDLYNLRNNDGLEINNSRIKSRKNQLINKIVYQDRIHKIKQIGVITGFIALIAMSGWLYYKSSTDHAKDGTIVEQSQNVPEWVSIRNTQKTETLPVALPERSYVFLDPGSYIKYDKNNFLKERIVHLKGSAFFMVEHQDNTPFVVQSEQFETTVLGTEFYVSDGLEMNESYVKVTQGSVRVEKNTSSENERELAVLSQMESLYLNKQNKNFQIHKENINKATGAEIKKISMAYRDTPVHDIFKDLAEKFKVKIHFDKNVLKDCTLTASFTDKNLDQVLYIICRLLDASYLEDQGQIEIYSKGCNK